MDPTPKLESFSDKQIYLSGHSFISFFTFLLLLHLMRYMFCTGIIPECPVLK